MGVYEDTMPPERPRPSILNFHASLGFTLYELKKQIEAAGGTADSVTIGSGAKKATVTFAEIDTGFATADSDWEKNLADSKGI